MNPFAQRLNLLRFPGETQKEFAERLGMKQPQLNRYLRGKSHPSREVIEKIAKVCNVNANWLLYGEDPELYNLSYLEEQISLGTKFNPQEYILIPRVRRRAAEEVLETPEEAAFAADYIHVPLVEGAVTAGPNGGLLLDKTLETFPFKKKWALRRFGRSDKHLQSLVLVRVTGDSMHPTISEGELVLVDTFEIERIQIKQGGIYLVRLPEEGITLKRLVLIRTTKEARLVCMSDNSRYAPFELAIPEGHEIKEYVLGRVRWAGKEFD